jgi:bifunctional non-homologous end joining protein LigD
MASESQTAVCQVKFTEWTRDDRLRQPVFLGIREDQNAIGVVREKATLPQ